MLAHKLIPFQMLIVFLIGALLTTEFVLRTKAGNRPDAKGSVEGVLETTVWRYFPPMALLSFMCPVFRDGPASARLAINACSLVVTVYFSVRFVRRLKSC